METPGRNIAALIKTLLRLAPARERPFRFAKDQLPPFALRNSIKNRQCLFRNWHIMRSLVFLSYLPEWTRAHSWYRSLPIEPQRSPGVFVPSTSGGVQSRCDHQDRQSLPRWQRARRQLARVLLVSLVSWLYRRPDCSLLNLLPKAQLKSRDNAERVRFRVTRPLSCSTLPRPSAMVDRVMSSTGTRSRWFHLARRRRVSDRVFRLCATSA